MTSIIRTAQALPIPSNILPITWTTAAPASPVPSQLDFRLFFSNPVTSWVFPSDWNSVSTHHREYPTPQCWSCAGVRKSSSGRWSFCQFHEHPDVDYRVLTTSRGDGACGKTSALNVFTRGWDPPPIQSSTWADSLDSSQQSSKDWLPATCDQY